MSLKSLSDDYMTLNLHYMFKRKNKPFWKSNLFFIIPGIPAHLNFGVKILPKPLAVSVRVRQSTQTQENAVTKINVKTLIFCSYHKLILYAILAHKK